MGFPVLSYGEDSFLHPSFTYGNRVEQDWIYGLGSLRVCLQAELGVKIYFKKLLIVSKVVIVVVVIVVVIFVQKLLIKKIHVQKH